MSIRAEIQSKDRGRTSWVRFSYPESTGFPASLCGALVAAGWFEDGFKPAPPFDGVAEIVFCSPGTYIFGGWTLQEKPKKLRALRAVLRKFSIPTETVRLGIMDLL